MPKQSCGDFRGFGNKPTGARSRSMQLAKSGDEPEGDLKIVMEDAVSKAWTFEHKPKAKAIYRVEAILADQKVLILLCPDWKLGWWKRFLTQHRLVTAFTVDRAL
jgi:hypothetical protein